jgi:hypothetical protein
MKGRYIALQNNKQGEGPLASYFKGEVLHGRDTDIFTSNMCKFVIHLYGIRTNLPSLDLAEDVNEIRCLIISCTHS